jgi:hypothetical protein
MWGPAVRNVGKSLIVSSLLALGACSLPALPEMDTFRAPTADALFRPLSVTNYKDKVLPPVAPDDLVDAGGRCAGAFVPAAAEGDQPAGQTNVSLQEAGVPMIPAAISLDMSECDVVKRAGVAEKVDIGANERNERTVTLTYINGQRPGIYYFTAGRLKSMERAPEPPAPVKPVKPAKKRAKSRQAATATVR